MGTGALDNTDSITGLCPVILPAQSRLVGKLWLLSFDCSPFDSLDLLKQVSELRGLDSLAYPRSIFDLL